MFNIGLTGFSNSSVLKIVNDPCCHTDFKDIDAAWMAWNKSQGELNMGLVNRRLAELDIYNQGVYHGW